MSSIRRTSVIATGIVALGAASMAFAGITGKALEDLRGRAAEAEQPRSQPAPPAAPPAAQPAPRAEPPPAAPRAPQPEPNFRNGQQQSRAAQPPPQPQGNAQSGNRGNSPRYDMPHNDIPHSDMPRNDTARGSSSRGVVGEMLSRNLRNADANNGGSGNHSSGGSGNQSGGGYSRPPRIVPSLPHGHRNYQWNGHPYYTYGGMWYQPYGSSYISIGVPYGLFVSTLPGYSTSFYYGNTRYYYYDDTYYTYEPTHRGYVVSRSPYGEDEEDGYYYDDAIDEDMYIYPAQGQSEQQQADDRYACHRWAVEETGYDPIDSVYDRAKRAGYQRAMKACLTGRGYSVR